MGDKRFASSKLGDTTCHATTLLAYYAAVTPTTTACDFDWTYAISRCNLNCRWLLPAVVVGATGGDVVGHDLLRHVVVQRKGGCGSWVGL